MKPKDRLILAAIASFLLVGLLIAAAKAPANINSRLAEWRNGVWISGDGTYTIYTNDHYFVVSFEGDTTSPNLYFGASQVKYTSKGMARKQTIRYRQMPDGQKALFKATSFLPENTEAPLIIDTSLFKPGVCNIKDGVIYDAVTEVTDKYILLATCNGDKEKIFSDGRSVYLPADGGEFYSYRVEKIGK
jgi:hypothetical protein